MAISGVSVYRADLLVHSAGKVFLGQLATRLIVGAFVHLDTLQISRDNVFAFSCITQIVISSIGFGSLAEFLRGVGCVVWSGVPS